jgi:hypothetical protein
LPAPPSRVFLDAEDRRLPIVYSPVIGARAPVSERLGWLASRAAAAAASPLTKAGLARPALVAVTAAPRPGLSASDLVEAELAVSLELGGGTAALRASGEAGVFSALARIERLLAEGARREGPTAAVIVAVDSFVSIEAIAAELAASSPWALSSPPPSEGAGAIAVMAPAAARAAGLPIFGTITGVALTQGSARDDNDDPVDGAAMTAALRELPASPPVQMVFGQQAVDALRLREWQMTAARHAERFDPDCGFDCVESYVGRVGAAAGLMNLAYGLSVYRHGAGPVSQPRAGLFYAWAISRDGARGIASCRAGAP